MTAGPHPPGDLDLYLLGEGRHLGLHHHLGAHLPDEGEAGVTFAVWAPAATHVSVVGDWNGWNRADDPLELLGTSGVWSGHRVNAAEGHRYKFAITGPDGTTVEHAELPPFLANRLQWGE